MSQTKRNYHEDLISSAWSGPSTTEQTRPRRSVVEIGAAIDERIAAFRRDHGRHVRCYSAFQTFTNDLTQLTDELRRCAR